MHIKHSEAEFERLWGEESARRAAEYVAGTVQGVCGKTVAEKARKIADVNRKHHPSIKTEYLSAEFIAAYNQALEQDSLPLDQWRAF
ncbi:hypothetical protein ACH518_01680 [Methylomonas sp. HW2-6]|uniref:hypothetical protein n=1 Tax=Methylomonas sp. HW2-6 TaxID=3376687 RepID=UPI004041F056